MCIAVLYGPIEKCFLLFCHMVFYNDLRYLLRDKPSAVPAAYYYEAKASIALNTSPSSDIVLYFVLNAISSLNAVRKSR